MTGPRIGELFAGYGGLGLGVKAAIGGDVAWVSDVCKFAKDGTAGHATPHRSPCSILAHRYPDVPNLGDITTVDWSQVEPVDVITGGSPCQDLSHAGKRAGMTDGTRSNLWVAMREAIAQLRPGLVVWENVRGAYSACADSDLGQCPRCVDPAYTGGHAPILRALGRVLGDLSDLGYVGGWHGLRAADVGAPHGRFRVFVVAYPEGYAGRLGHRDGAAAPIAADLGHEWAGRARDGWAGPTDGGLLPTPRATDGTKGGPNQRGSSGDLMLPSAVAGLMLPTPSARDWKDHTIRREPHRPDDVDTLARALTDVPCALLPTPTTEPDTGNGHARNLGAEARLLPTPSVADSEGGHERRGGTRGDELLLNGVAKEMARLLPTPRTANNENRQSEGYGGEDGNFHGLLNNPERWGEYADAIARWEVVLTRPAPAPTMTSTKGNPQLAPAFVEWMMGLPAGWVTDVPGITRNEALKALGNGVVPQQAEAALRLLLTRTQVAA